MWPRWNRFRFSRPQAVQMVQDLGVLIVRWRVNQARIANSPLLGLGPELEDDCAVLEHGSDTNSNFVPIRPRCRLGRNDRLVRFLWWRAGDMDYGERGICPGSATIASGDTG
jgi:hypothetical protein